jgi:hypothetical protein
MSKSFSPKVSRVYNSSNGLSATMFPISITPAKNIYIFKTSTRDFQSIVGYLRRDMDRGGKVIFKSNTDEGFSDNFLKVVSMRR